MSKFGDLIDVDIPVLLNFYGNSSQSSEAVNSAVRDVALSLGAKAKVIKINVDKNLKLAEALRVKNLPTLIIYKNGEMKWRHSGEHDTDSLIEIMQSYL